MTGTFSTVINFTLLGFLHCLHHLQIQLELESEMQETGIKYPRVMAHTKKVGYEALKEIIDLKCISDQYIIATINQANSEAVSNIRELEMTFTHEELDKVISRSSDKLKIVMMKMMMTMTVMVMMMMMMMIIQKLIMKRKT